MRLPISVIIPTMNRPESLERTIKNMAASKDVPSQLVVVDQSEAIDQRKKNEKVLKSFNDVFGNVKYVYQETPSMTKARNNGFGYAVNEIVVMSDDDVDVNSDTFDSLVSLFNDDKIAMVAAIDELTEHSKTNIGYFLGTKSFINRRIGHVTNSMLSRYPDHITKQTDTQWAQGYFFAIRKSLVDKWNLKWDENFISYAYAEDMDFSYSYYKLAKKNNLKCVLDPKVKVKHLATLEYRVPNEKSIFMYIINREYLRQKHELGFKGFMACNWSEWWMFVHSVITQNNPDVFLKAYLSKFKYAKDIRKGNLDYEKFMK